VTGEAARVRVVAPVAQNVDEHAVATLGVQPVDRVLENAVVVHAL